jgi:hypothetical protein
VLSVGCGGWGKRVREGWGIERKIETVSKYKKYKQQQEERRNYCIL